jgi:hypothetical protein
MDVIRKQRLPLIKLIPAIEEYQRGIGGLTQSRGLLHQARIVDGKVELPLPWFFLIALPNPIVIVREDKRDRISA